MFIQNITLNKNKLLKITIIFSIILISFLLLFSIRLIYNTSKVEGNSVKNNINTDITEITSSDYTNFLKDAHENIDNYVGANIKICGYVYRMSDFTDTQFVLSRTMILNSANSAVVVGILTEYEKSSELEDGDWVEIVGTITKGNYKGEMPVLNVNKIELTQKPEDEYVYPPSI